MSVRPATVLSLTPIAAAQVDLGGATSRACCPGPASQGVTCRPPAVLWLQEWLQTASALLDKTDNLEEPFCICQAVRRPACSRVFDISIIFR